jgi:hypothetical protein
MNASPATPLLQAMAQRNIATLRFQIRPTRRRPRTPRATYVEATTEPPALTGVSVATLFSAFGLPPLAGDYTLNVAGGTLCYAPPGPGTARRPSDQHALKGKS